jgi:hypothetical protein
MIQKDFFRNYFDGLMKSLNFAVSVFQGAKNFLNKPSNKNLILNPTKHFILF